MGSIPVSTYHEMIEKREGDEKSKESKESSEKDTKKDSKMRRKKRGERVQVEDRNKVCGVHNGKGYVKRQLVNPICVGLKWGERAKTRKPCRKGADRNLKARMKRIKKPAKKS